MDVAARRIALVKPKSSKDKISRDPVAKCRSVPSNNSSGRCPGGITPTGIVKEATGPNNGQWGLTQDNFGKLYFMNAGGERGPQSFQVPVVYGGFNPRLQFETGFEEVFPLPGDADVQGGPNRFRPDGKWFSTLCWRGTELPRRGT